MVFGYDRSPLAVSWRTEQTSNPPSIALLEEAAKLKSENGTKTFVVVVEDINRDAIQDIGALFDLDPSFLAQYLGGEANELIVRDDGLRELRSNFLDPLGKGLPMESHVYGK